MNTEMAALLTEALETMEQNFPERDGESFDACDKCDGARGEHSLPCRIRKALKAVQS